MLGLVLLILPILVSGNNTTALHKSSGDTSPTPGDPTPSPDYTFLNDEHKLKRKLFAKDDKGLPIYDVHLRPVNKARDVVSVSASLAIVSIIDLDEKSQRLSTSGWLKMQWTDIRLRWDPNEYGGVENINIPAKYLWKPDLMVYNSVDDSLPLDDSRVLAIIYHTGMVLWMPPKQIHTVCSISLHHFPYDTQKCDIEIGSWTYSNKSIQLSVYGEEDVVDDSHFVEHNAWILKTSKARLKGKKYDCCPDIYQSVVIDLQFRRRSEYYTHVYVTPAVVLSMLIPFIFLMPSHSGEKTVLGTGLILGFVIMMVVLESFSMSSMSSAPLIVKYYASNVVIAAIAMALTHSFALFWRGRWRSPPPKALTCLIVGGVGKLVMVKHHGYAEVEEEHNDGEIHDTELQTELDNMQNIEHDNSPIVRSSENQLSSTKRAMMDWKLIVMVLDRLFFLIFLTVVIFVTIITIAYAGEPDDVIAEVGIEVK